MKAPFPILGLTGGIAAGKSTVARMLTTKGWAHIDADQIAREAVTPGSPGLASIANTFGPTILTQDGRLDRAKLGALVFSAPDLRARLDAILHPLMDRMIEERIASLPPDSKGAVLDAALWIEAGKGHTFDALWVVEAPLELRCKRIMERDGLTEQAAWNRIHSQMSQPERALHADLVIQTDGRTDGHNLLDILCEAEDRLLVNWKKRRRDTWRIPMKAPFTPTELQGILGTLLSRGGDLADVFVEMRQACSLGMEDGRMEDLLSSETFGVSLRLMDAETTRFADLIAPSLQELQEAALTLAAPGKGTPLTVGELALQQFATPSPISIDPSTIPIPDKVDVVKKTEAKARLHGETLSPGSVKQVAAGYGDSTQRVWVATAEKIGDNIKASLVEDCRVQGILRVNVTAGDGKQLQTGFQALGETRGFELFSDQNIEKTAREAARLAIQALQAKAAPSGTFPVILSSSAGGTMIHEACGHGLEADLALAGMSAFSGKLGQQVAATGVTIIDDGTLPHKRGSAAMDDEGCPAQRVVLIENGILKGYLHSRKTARRMDTSPSGNGRKENYRQIPIPRMRNTFLAPGTESPEAIMKDLDKGLLVKHMGGGQVDTVTGNFVFQIREGYWVEKGVAQYPIKNATLSGCGPDVIKELTRIGSDLEHFDIGTCGKDGQGVPVSDAIPTILCPSLVVGGTGD